MKRILYVKITETKYCSKGTINTISKGEVRTYFDLADMTWRVTSAQGTELIASGTATSRHKLLVAIKKVIDTLGSAYSREKRKDRLTEEQRELVNLNRRKKFDNDRIKRLTKMSYEEAQKELEKIKEEIRNIKSIKKDFI